MEAKAMTEVAPSLPPGEPRSLDQQMVDLLEQFEKTGEQFMLARCVELFREGLGCGFEEADASEAQAKRVDKKQAFRALESALSQYADALRRMEAAKERYENEAAEYKRSLSLLDTQQPTKSPAEIQQELEAKLRTLSNLEAQRAQLQQALAEEEASCEQLRQEVDGLNEKKEDAAHAATLSAAHATAERAVQKAKSEVDRVRELIAATEYLSDFEVVLDGLAGSAAGGTERLHIKAPKVEFLLAFSTTSGKLTDIEIVGGQLPISPSVIKQDADRLEPPNDLRFALTMMRAASEARECVERDIEQIRQRYLVSEEDGDSVAISFHDVVKVHVKTHYAYPTVPAGVYVTHISLDSVVDQVDFDLGLLASEINTAAYRTLMDVVSHIEKRVDITSAF